MSGYQQILKIKRLEEEITKLGLRWRACYRYGGEKDLLELLPLEDLNALPIYARDAAVFAGSIEELEVWLRGVEWARNYDRMIGLADDKKRLQKEKKYLEQQTFYKLQKGN